MFIENDWKITRRLTLNIGLRYGLYTQPVDARDVGGLYHLDRQGFVLPGQDGFSRVIARAITTTGRRAWGLHTRSRRTS